MRKLECYFISTEPQVGRTEVGPIEICLYHRQKRVCTEDKDALLRLIHRGEIRAMNKIYRREKRIVLWHYVVLVFCLWSVVNVAEARVGGGGSFGSRGSRSFSAPERPSSPAPGSALGGRDNPSSSLARPYAPRPEEPYARSNPYSSPSSFCGGGFWGSVSCRVFRGNLGKNF